MSAPSTEQLLRLLRSDVHALIARAEQLPEADRRVALLLAAGLALAMRYPGATPDLLQLTGKD